MISFSVCNKKQPCKFQVDMICISKLIGAVYLTINRLLVQTISEELNNNTNLGNIDVCLSYFALIKIRFNRTRKNVLITINGQSWRTLFIRFINTYLLFMISISKGF